MTVLAIAHRGDPVGHRENTLDAFRGALDAGADMIELDVRLTADGVPVVVHDATLDRIWGVARRVADLRADELRALGIPDLTEVLAALPAVQVMVDYEEPGVALPALDAVLAGDALDRCLFSGGCFDGHRAIKERADGARIAVTWTADEPCPDELLDELAAEFWNPSGDVLGRNRDQLERMRRRGTRVSVWTVDRRDDMQFFLDLGVDAVITNRVADLVELLERVC